MSDTTDLTAAELADLDEEAEAVRDASEQPSNVRRLSLRDTIAAAVDIEAEDVYIEAWDVTVRVKSMDAATRAEMVNRAAAQQSGDTPGGSFYERVYVDLVIICAYDPDTDERIFDEADRPMLMTKAASAVEEVALAAMKISGLGPKAVDEEAKDFSSAIPSDGSTSDSPEN